MTSNIKHEIYIKKKYRIENNIIRKVKDNIKMYKRKMKK